MDIDLGSGLDGTEAAEMILAERDIPLAFLSSHTDPDTVEKTEGITSFGYIVKNSGDTVLLASIKMAFRLYEAQRELKRQKQHLNSALAESERIEEELIRKSEELERYFSSSLDMLCIANTEGEFLRLNPEWERRLGYPLSELEGSSVLELVHPDDKEKTLQALSRLKNQEEVLDFENRYRHRDGSYRWIEWRSKPTGSTIYATARDITERRQAERDLKESEEKFRTMMSQTIDLFFLHDLEGRILDANEQAVRQLGYTREELLSMTIADLDPDYSDRDDSGRFWDQIRLNQPYLSDDPLP